ncbi:MAG: LEA type 2 family protein [Bacteroidetes bacterium]|nr:LEA type 2 family protein [Bacteroidota bacterium]
MPNKNYSLVAGRSGVTGKIALFLALVAGFASCRQPEAPEYYGFQDPQISRAGALTNVSATIKLYNPNPYDLKLLHADVDVMLNGKAAGHSVLDSTILIPRKDTFYVPVSMQVNLQSIFANALQVFLEKQVNISLDGHVRVRRGALTFRRPFHYDGKQDLNSLLSGGSGF